MYEVPTEFENLWPKGFGEKAVDLVEMMNKRFQKDEIIGLSIAQRSMRHVSSMAWIICLSTIQK